MESCSKMWTAGVNSIEKIDCVNASNLSAVRQCWCSDKLDIKIVDIILDTCKVSLYLGVWVNENLIWDTHVSQLSRSITYKIASLNKSSKCMSSQLLNQLYKSTNQPCIYYACSV